MGAPDTALRATRVDAVSTLAALARLAPEWDRLWHQAARTTPFQSPHWLLPWWKHIGRGTLATVAVRSSDGELVGLAPLYLHEDPVTRCRKVFPIGIGTTDDLEWLCLPGWEAQFLVAVLSHLAQSAVGFDVLELPQLRADSSLCTHATPAGWGREVLPGEPSPVLMLGGSQTAAALPIPAPMASNLRYCRRRAARAGALEYVLADGQSLPEFIDALVQLHGQRWDRRGLPGVLGDACVIAAHREAAPLLQAAGLLRLYGLRLDGQLIAVLYCLADLAPKHQHRWFYYIGGFDPQFAALSPGTLLVAHAIEQAIADAAAAFDFLRGAEPYKYRWGAVDQAMRTVRLWPEHSRTRSTR